MDSNDFLNDLFLQFDKAEVINLGFKWNVALLFDLRYKLNDNKILCISADLLNRAIDDEFLSINYKKIDAIISLPIYKDNDNILLLYFDKSKRSNKCLFIDESDSLLHNSDEVDWTYASSELIDRICASYTQYCESDNSVILNLTDIFKPQNQNVEHEITQPERVHKRFYSKNAVDANLADCELSNFKLSEEKYSKRRVISDELSDNLLLMKQHKSELQNNNLSFLNDLMYSKKRQNPENLLYKDNRQLIDGEVVFRKLGKISDLHNIYYKNDNSSILIATCKSCRSKLVFYNDEISDFEGEVYIELINISKDVSEEYLYEYLSSDNGLDELMYYSGGSSHITPDDIKNIRIPVPPLDVQKEIVNVARESKEFFKSVKLLMKDFNSNILDYKHMKSSLQELRGDIGFDGNTNEITKLPRSWRHAYKGLIWPLAISYLSATKGGFEIVEKKDNYLVLFEFIAAFNSIVMLSALPEDVYQSNFSRIWDARSLDEYRHMSFSNWVYLSKNLSNLYKYNNFTLQLGGDLFEKITDDKILTILEKAKNLRNDEFHGSQSNAYEAERIVEKLDVYLDEIFDILDVYSDYKLFYTTGNVEAKNKSYNHRVILLNGPCAQPIYGNIIFDEVLEGESIYLYNPKNNQKIVLLDNFIKFLPIDKNKKRWALFVYSSCDKKEFGAFYKCYQSRENDVKINISSLKDDILNKGA